MFSNSIARPCKSLGFLSLDPTPSVCHMVAPDEGDLAPSHPHPPEREKRTCCLRSHRHLAFDHTADLRGDLSVSLDYSLVRTRASNMMTARVCALSIGRSHKIKPLNCSLVLSLSFPLCPGSLPALIYFTPSIQQKHQSDEQGRAILDDLKGHLGMRAQTISR